MVLTFYDIEPIQNLNYIDKYLMVLDKKMYEQIHLQHPFLDLKIYIVFSFGN
jgi:hypothetical protein